MNKFSAISSGSICEGLGAPSLSRPLGRPRVQGRVIALQMLSPAFLFTAATHKKYASRSK